MTTIHTLPPSLVAQIAAGQVVESPTSVIKELVENALDAKARHIEVYIKRSGFDRILVVDDGQGMSEDDIKISYKSHTTSKISESADLTDITSYGFRGEALSSISSVATVTIKSKTRSNLTGASITIKRGIASKLRSVGMANGTSVEVTDLFRNIPARLKHVKSPTSEIKHILACVLSYSLAHPEIDFRLINNNKPLLVFRKAPQARRIRDVVGASIFSNLLPIKARTPDIAVSGYIGHPQIALRSSSYSYLFINNRPVTNPLIKHHIRRAYGTLLDSHTSPVFILFLTIPTVYIDVNITPTKTAVSLSNEQSVLKLLQQTITSTLKSNNLMYQFSHHSSYNKVLGRTLKSVAPPWDMRHTALANNSTVISLDNVYLAVSTESGILIVDQHAAHERILYNQFRQALTSKTVTEQIAPRKKVILTFTSNELILLAENRTTLTSIGFEFEPFGMNSFEVTRIPQIFENIDTEKLLRELIEVSLDDLTNDTVAMTACKAAIKEGSPLHQKEAILLINKLITEDEYYTCPHGRPTIISLNRGDLDSLFKRK